MPYKDIGSYRQVIQAVANRMRQVTNRRWRPSVVILDFEQASMIAFETEFPRISVKGCYFHFNQSLWRAIHRNNLVNAYRNSRQLKRCVKKIMALGFLPLALVRINFNRLQNSNSTANLIQRLPQLRVFSDILKTINKR